MLRLDVNDQIEGDSEVFIVGRAMNGEVKADICVPRGKANMFIGEFKFSKGSPG